MSFDEDNDANGKVCVIHGRSVSLAANVAVTDVNLGLDDTVANQPSELLRSSSRKRNRLIVATSRTRKLLTLNIGKIYME